MKSNLLLTKVWLRMEDLEAQIQNRRRTVAHTSKLLTRTAACSAVREFSR